MRAWHVEAPGPVTGHPLRLHPDDEVPRPGPGELLLRVLACGVCRTDLHVTEGDLPPHKPGTLSIAGIHLTDIPPLNYEKHPFQERQLRSVTANTRQDAREFLGLAAEHHLNVTVHPYPLDTADQALRDLKARRFDGAAVLNP